MRKLCCNHNGSDVFGVERSIIRIDAKPLQHPNQALLCENVACKGVTSTVQTNDQPIAYENIFTYPFNIDDIFDPGLRV
jgi:hypothetical protein